MKTYDREFLGSMAGFGRLRPDSVSPRRKRHSNTLWEKVPWRAPDRWD